MTQEEKQLLLKDLCARRPYGVIVHAIVDGGGTLLGVYKDRVFTACEDADKHNDYPIECIKPYLRPMSSMTEEEDKEWQIYKNNIAESCDERLEEKISELHDWFNSHHFDFHHLIEKGLAIEAKEGMYKIK